MRRNGGGRAIRALIASLAVLLPAGALAAATVDGGQGRDQQVRATGFSQEGIVAGPIAAGQTPAPPAPAPQVVTTTTPAPPLPPPPPTRITSSTVTTAPRATTTTTTTTQPPQTSPTWWVPPGAPPIPYTTIPGGSSWSNRNARASVRMHIEPARPVAGQPVTFHVDYLITQDPCCIVGLMFGESPTFTNLTSGGGGGGGGCDSPTSLSDLSVTHTYAAPGAYEAVLSAATFPCGPIIGDPPHRAIHGVGLHACIVVGPGDAGAGGCPSAPPIYVLPPAGG
jgi:hypothetical protein